MTDPIKAFRDACGPGATAGLTDETITKAALAFLAAMIAIWSPEKAQERPKPQRLSNDELDVLRRRSAPGGYIPPREHSVLRFRALVSAGLIEQAFIVAKKAAVYSATPAGFAELERKD